MENIKNRKLGFAQKIKLFFKKNGYAFTISVCVLAVITALTVSIVVRKNNIKVENVEPNVPISVNEEIPQVSAEPVSSYNPLILTAPVENYTLGMNYSMNQLIYNKTLNEWATHSGVDLIAEVGTEVVSACDGVVSDITYSVLDGTVITIQHQEDITTVYKSLSNDVDVNVGDNVTAGQVIGRVSDSAGREANEGAHVHFEVYKNGEIVDPGEYIFDK